MHGGAWCRGDRHDEDRFNRMLAQHGVGVAALDFRMPPQTGYPASIADINPALRWLKVHAESWGSRPDRVGVMGVSSGAHQAMLAAMRPRDARYAALPLADDPGADATAAFVVLCWPVIDPLGRYHYARELQGSGKPYPEAIDRVIPDHLKYWGDEAAMEEGSPLRALERGEAVATPPVLYLQGERDIVHPRAHLDRFVAVYRAAGGALTLRLFPRRGGRLRQEQARRTCHGRGRRGGGALRARSRPLNRQPEGDKTCSTSCSGTSAR
ncbi:alpha/beta hydrolase [Ramlibacter terrae]|uniref:Alpha/beta hydrolase n=1 Tax=Ramlibacter terrae TaxID=2732511 RepID=A0ABX6NZM4_9BURK|nr:alpha/beta hydrolase [Ramlibacter terrae]